MTRVMVVAPHPDDETLGCGGTLLKHIAQGDCVSWVTVTQMSKECGYSQKTITAREQEIDRVRNAFGFDHHYQLTFPATRLEEAGQSSLIKAAQGVITEFKPEHLFLPFPGDIHSEHQFTFNAFSSLTKSFRNKEIRKIYCYETLSETEFGINPLNPAFSPNVFVDISDFVSKKIEIMKMYPSEIEEFPFPRSERNIRALANLRGATIGVEAAESFMLLREIR